jgi:hypothetical protein
MNKIKVAYYKLKWKWLCRGFSIEEKAGAQLVSLIVHFWTGDWKKVIDEFDEVAIKAVFAFLGKYDNIERFKMHPQMSADVMYALRKSPHYTYEVARDVNKMLSDNMGI